MVRVYVLGGLRVESEDDAASVPASHKARLLLGLLAVERRVHGRSELAGRLWPDVRVNSARATCATRWRSCAARWVRRPSGWLPWTALASPWLLRCGPISGKSSGC